VLTNLRKRLSTQLNLMLSWPLKVVSTSLSALVNKVYLALPRSRASLIRMQTVGNRLKLVIQKTLTKVKCLLHIGQTK